MEGFWGAFCLRFLWTVGATGADGDGKRWISLMGVSLGRLDQVDVVMLSLLLLLSLEDARDACLVWQACVTEDFLASQVAAGRSDGS